MKKHKKEFFFFIISLLEKRVNNYPTVKDYSKVKKKEGYFKLQLFYRFLSNSTAIAMPTAIATMMAITPYTIVIV